MVSTPQLLALGLNAMRLAAAREAVQQLGLLEAVGEEIIYHLLDERFAEHPRTLTTAYRKDGEQLARDELKALGLRANAFMSRKAFGELTEAGKADPLRAHETTLLRAWFTLARWRSLLNHEATLASLNVAPEAVSFKYDVLAVDCPACQSLNEKVVRVDQAAIFPPSDCVCTTANYGFRFVIDWLYDVQ